MVVDVVLLWRVVSITSLMTLIKYKVSNEKLHLFHGMCHITLSKTVENKLTMT
jgi:hypothetical protein